MKLLVLSDSHGSIEKASCIIDRIGDKLAGVIHLGDHDSDGYLLKKQYGNLPFYVVRGNNDYGLDTPESIKIKCQGKTILAVHGHKQRVHWNMNTLYYWGQEQDADAVLFGHTHTPFLDIHGTVALFNPGSISLPRNTSEPTFGILSFTEEGKMEFVVMAYFGPRDFRRLRGLEG